MQQNSDISAKPHSSIGVIGAGAWGTALALVASGAGRAVTLWARDPGQAKAIQEARENGRHLPGVALPKDIRATHDMKDAAASDALLLAVPAQALSETLRLLQPLVRKGQPLILCAKGVDLKTGRLLTEVLTETLPHIEPAILSGPSFARDVAKNLPTAIVIAAKSQSVALGVQATLGGPAFRPYVSDDLVGVALGGAAKNVYAIASGMVEGAGLGENARAALLARGFAELLRLGAAMGAKSETLMGLSGLGDLALSATSMSSRNFAFGAMLGKGGRPTASGPLAEGAATAPALVARGHAQGVELPVAEAVADVLSQKIDVAQAAQRLLARPFKAE